MIYAPFQASADYLPLLQKQHSHMMTASRNGDAALSEKTHLDRASDALLKAIALFTFSGILAGSAVTVAVCVPGYLTSAPALAASATILVMNCFAGCLVVNALGGPMEARFDQPGKAKRVSKVIVYVLCVNLLMLLSIKVVIDAWLVSFPVTACSATPT